MISRSCHKTPAQVYPHNSHERRTDTEKRKNEIEITNKKKYLEDIYVYVQNQMAETVIIGD